MPAFNFEAMGNSSVYFSSWYVKMCSISSCGLVAIAQSDRLEWLIKSLNTLALCFFAENATGKANFASALGIYHNAWIHLQIAMVGITPEF